MKNSKVNKRLRFERDSARETASFILGGLETAILEGRRWKAKTIFERERSKELEARIDRITTTTQVMARSRDEAAALYNECQDELAVLRDRARDSARVLEAVRSELDRIATLASAKPAAWVVEEIKRIRGLASPLANPSAAPAETSEAKA